MGAKLLAPEEGWWPLATKWGPLGLLDGKNEVWGATGPSFQLLWRADGLFHLS